MSTPVPGMSRSSLAVSKSHTLTVPSSEHVQNLASVGQKLSSRTGTPACASISLTLFSVGCQYLSRPALSPEIIHSPLWLQTEVRMATSCACCVVSKLKLRPDQSVNMPLAVEASSRRDSGVQQTWLTGQRSLLLLMCTKREQMPEVALLRHAAGGSISRTAFSVEGIVTGACRSSGRKMRSLIILRPGPAWSTVRRTMGLRMARDPSSAPCCTCSGCIGRELPAAAARSRRRRAGARREGICGLTWKTRLRKWSFKRTTKPNRAPTRAGSNLNRSPRSPATVWASGTPGTCAESRVGTRRTRCSTRGGSAGTRSPRRAAAPRRSRSSGAPPGGPRARRRSRAGGRLRARRGAAGRARPAVTVRARVGRVG